MTAYDHVWWWKPGGPWGRPDHKGKRCRVVIRARRMNSILVEFADGEQVVTSRYAVRRCEPNDAEQMELL